MKTTLLVIDVQNAMCHGEYAVYDAPGLIARTNGLIATARASDIPIIFVQHEEPMWMEPGMESWKLAEGLAVLPTDTVVGKRSCDSFHETTLGEVLAETERLVVCGLQTEYCVDTTVRRALSLGYHVTLVGDAHSTCDTATLTAPQVILHHNETLRNLTNFGPTMQVVMGSEVAW